MAQDALDHHNLCIALAEEFLNVNLDQLYSDVLCSDAPVVLPWFADQHTDAVNIYHLFSRLLRTAMNDNTDISSKRFKYLVIQQFLQDSWILQTNASFPLFLSDTYCAALYLFLCTSIYSDFPYISQ